MTDDTPALIDHILSRYHETHRRELQDLIKLALTVETVHAGHREVPDGMADLLRKIAGELEVHMKKEELILFPAMRRQAAGKFDMPIAQMRHDHDAHGEHLRALDELTGGLTPPKDACGSWQTLYAGTAKFVDDLTEHIRLENDTLFPRFESGGRP